MESRERAKILTKYCGILQIQQTSEEQMEKEDSKSEKGHIKKVHEPVPEVE
jgi:hypothetical protein